ncbi:MAG: pilB1 [Candidatus Berkelbacteria bacterium]|nr:pilB1 [Candidatus Berkelbacteria bacterium]
MNINTDKSQKRLFDVLLENGKINPQNSQSLRLLSNQELDNRLRSQNIVSDEDINKGYSSILNIPYVDLKDKTILREILNIIPENLAQEYKIIAYDQKENILKVAIANPGKLTSNLERTLNDIKAKKNINIEIAITSMGNLNSALSQYRNIKEEKTIPEINVEIQSPQPAMAMSTNTLKTVDLEKIQIPFDVISKFPEDIARKYQMVVFEAPHSSFIKVAVADPDDKKVKEILEFVREKNDIGIEEYKSTPGQIHLAMQYYQPPKPAVSASVAVPATSVPIQQEVEEKPRQFVPKPQAPLPQTIPLKQEEMPIKKTDDETPEIKREEKVPEVQSKIAVTQPILNPEEGDLDKYLGMEIKEIGDLLAIAEDSNIPKTLAAAIALAVRRKASDIHVEPAEKNMRIRFRVDGILRDIIKLPLEEQPAIISRIKILAKLKIDESRIPQDGRFDCSTAGHQIDLRISTLPTVHGEKAAMRILDKSLKMYTMEELGITGRGLKILTENIDKPYGVVLSTGPTGSGKSTTLYAILNRISTASVNIVTLEDPVEYEVPGINQCQIKPKIGFTFANGLRSVLRQDPNIIMVGEIRDSETASLATHAALTGHLVLSTLHTNDATGALPRLINMGVEPFLITSSINCVIGQRLVRRLCQKCKKPAHIPDPVFNEIEEQLARFNLPKPYQFFEGRGCPECDQGYKGRVGIYEVFAMSDKIESLAIDRRPASEIREAAIKEGMVTMKHDGLFKALKGITSVNEVLRVVTI